MSGMIYVNEVDDAHHILREVSRILDNGKNWCKRQSCRDKNTGEMVQDMFRYEENECDYCLTGAIIRVLGKDHVYSMAEDNGPLIRNKLLESAFGDALQQFCDTGRYKPNGATDGVTVGGHMATLNDQDDTTWETIKDFLDYTSLCVRLKADYLRHYGNA